MEYQSAMRSQTASNDDRLPGALPSGVTRRLLKTHPDSRGDFTEIFRNEWQESPLPVQWNLCRNNPNVLRGVQVHARHWDYVCVIAGELHVGLRDLRPDATGARATMVLLTSHQLEILVIPAGVAHGLYSPRHSTHLVGVSHYYDPGDDARCRWDAPELELDWPCDRPDLSAADLRAPGYHAFVAAYLAAKADHQRNV